MKYSKTITYKRKDGKEISYTRTYNNKYGKGASLKTVKVKNKKTGKVYSYTYKEYRNNGKVVFRRRAEIIMKDGELTPYGREWIEEYKKGLDISDINTLDSKEIFWERHGETITVDKLQSLLKKSDVERYIYNMGGEPDDVAKSLSAELGVKEDILRDSLFNEKKWDFKEGTFTYTPEMGDPIVYAFTFTYADHVINWERQ